MLGEFGAELRRALTGLRKSPGFTAAAVLTLALGLGANTDHATTFGAVIVNEAMAGTYWPGEDPVGKRVGIGLAAGLVLALSTTRLTASFLHGVSPTDPLTFAAASAMLALAAVAVCALPGIRASRIDPLTAIRRE